MVWYTSAFDQTAELNAKLLLQLISSFKNNYFFDCESLQFIRKLGLICLLLYHRRDSTSVLFQRSLWVPRWHAPLSTPGIERKTNRNIKTQYTFAGERWTNASEYCFLCLVPHTYSNGEIASNNQNHQGMWCKTCFKHSVAALTTAVSL